MTPGVPPIASTANTPVSNAPTMPPIPCTPKASRESSGFVGPMGALIIGICAGAACYWGAVALKGWGKYDDSLDAFGVHGIGGIVGALLTGVFAVEAIGGTPGVIEGNVAQLWPQALGIIVTVVYCGVASFVILKVLDLTMGLRVEERVELEGLDVRLHGERGYEI